MSGKKASSYAFQKLGSKQEKILFFLAENPNKNAQAIQKELRYPDSQYGNISKTAKMLEKIGLLKSTKGKSEKNVLMSLYSCNEEGVFYALAKNPTADVLSILDSYENEYDLFKSFRHLIDVWGVGFFVDFVRNISELLPMIHKDGLQKALPFMFMKMKIAIDATNPDPKQRKIFARKTMQQFPQLKPMIRKWAKSMNELVGE